MKRFFLSPPVLLFVAAVAVYGAGGSSVVLGDMLPARYLPWSLLRELDFDLDEFPELHGEEARSRFPLLDGIPYYLRLRGEHYVSAYSPAPALFVLPLYAVPVLAGLPPSPFWARALEKGAAATVTALSAVFLYLAVARLASRRWAMVVALVYAFGTSSLSLSSQALWQHGPSQCALALALYLLVRGLGDERRLPWAMLAMAGAAVLRETNALLLAPLAVVLLFRFRRDRRMALRLVLFALPPVVAMAAYYGLHFAAAGTGAGHESVPLLAYFHQTALLVGVGGVLASPGRGLFVYSPVLLFALAGLATTWHRGPAPFRALALGLPLVVLVVGKWFMWWGGHCFGPRLLADTTPVLCFFLYPLGELLSRRRALGVLFGFAAGLSVAVHALGAFAYDGRWDAAAETDRNPGRLWSWRRGPITFYAGEAMDRAYSAASVRTLPTSADAPALLAAAYEVESIPATVCAGEPFALAVTATNTGRALWLAAPPGDRGRVGLAWRWLADGATVSEGRELLATDVSPGGSARLRTMVTPPSTGGERTLEIQMVSELVVWFSSQGSPPVTASVAVRAPCAPDLGGLLAAVPEEARGAPSLAVATDRTAYQAADRLALTVRLANPGPPRSFDAFMVVREAGGRAWFFDGERLHPAGPPPWPPWIRRLPLPAAVTGRFTLPVSALAAGRLGRFTWGVVLTEPGGSRPVAQASTTFTVKRSEAEALAAAAGRAAERIRSHQAAAGFWPTAVTPCRDPGNPTSEVNVFVPALMVDLLEPVAKETGLGDAIERSRAWLAAQIEETGLVRYHGNTGPVTDPGCELPPDADDTALAWRLAPRREGALREAARAEIEKYRTGDGLYRVWLAPEDRYRCFYRYSGREPNPTDIAIQMHVHLFLASHDPEAARRLCDALQPRMADPRVWVYYEAAPFVPLLREAEMARAGCPLRVPGARLRDQPKDQEPYLELAAHRGRLARREGGLSRAAVREVLLRLAADDFAAVERTPPLLYHNDLTATPPHFHWSADVGYALWLRSYLDSAR